MIFLTFLTVYLFQSIIWLLYFSSNSGVGEPPVREGETLRCTARFRYRQADQPVEARLEDGKLMIHALTPQRAVTPGQSAVLYQGDVCLGGGIVTDVLDAGKI